MKKLILPVILVFTFLFFLSQQINAQTEVNCWRAYEQEDYKCFKPFNECSDSCLDSANARTRLNVDGSKLYSECMKANDCEGKSRACHEQASANYRVCLKSGKQSTASEAKQEASAQDKKGLNIFKIFELFSQALMNLGKSKETQSPSPQGTPVTETLKQEGKLSTQAINDWIMENDLILDPAQIEQMEREKLDVELYGRTPQMTEEIIKKAQEDWKKTFEPAETKPATPFRARADFLKGDADIKYPGTDEWVPLKTGDIIPSGATLFTGMDATLVLSLQDKGVFQMLPFTEIVVGEETIKGASHTDIKLNTGDIEVSVEGGVYTGTLQVQTPSVVAGVHGTHFWVSYDKDKRLSVTGVYEGKVEVTPRGSNKSVTISPDGNPSTGSKSSLQVGSGQGKPGVAVITQKISAVKLTIFGLVLAAVAGGGIWFFKKRSLVKSSQKR